MAVQRTLLLIADITGYTRFMKLHTVSLAHAHDMVSRLIETVIDAARLELRLAKLEGRCGGGKRAARSAGGC